MSARAWADRYLILQNYKVQFQTRVKPSESQEDEPVYQYRKVQYINYYADLDAYSAITDLVQGSLQTTGRAASATITVKVGNTQTPESLPYITFTATNVWDYDDIDIQMQGNGVAHAVFTATDEGDWTDI